MIVPALKEDLHVRVCVILQFCGSRETQGWRILEPGLAQGWRILEPAVKVSPPEVAAALQQIPAAARICSR